MGCAAMPKTQHDNKSIPKIDADNTDISNMGAIGYREVELKTEYLTRPGGLLDQNHSFESVVVERELLCCVAGYVVLHSLTAFPLSDHSRQLDAA
jgi:hypothetical protein